MQWILGLFFFVGVNTFSLPSHSILGILWQETTPFIILAMLQNADKFEVLFSTTASND